LIQQDSPNYYEL